MTATVQKRGNKYRVVEKATGSLVKKSNKPVDGGGHASKPAADKQASAINISQARKHGAKIPKKRK